MWITLAPHVLPRLLAHVLARASLKPYSFVKPRTKLYNITTFFVSISSLDHVLTYCPKFLTAVKIDRVVFIPICG